MRFTQYTDVHQLHDDAWPSLCQDEVANNLMLSPHCDSLEIHFGAT